jgi:subtilisin family serine protease/peptidoglycan hydrolase-like protein with peptidoglycan-binding domain
MDPGLLELIAAGAPTDEVAVIVRFNPGAKLLPDLRLVSLFGDIATARAERSKLAAIHDHPSVASLKAPRVYAGEIPPVELASDEPGISEADPTPNDSDIRRPVGVTETGRGTIIAVIDWGIDFAHPDFRDARGNSRLLALWDQRAPGKPAPYGYGRIHSRRAINRALAEHDPFAALGYQPSTGSAPSHGTHVMGIAAGSGLAGGPAGIAPESDLLFVHLGPGLGDLGNSVDLLEAIDFAVKTAGNRPIAINMSIGRHAGPHDGTLLIERAIDWLIINRPGTVVVQSTGNYYSRDVHMQGRLREARTARLPFNLPRSDGTPVTVEIWYKAPDKFSARAIAPDGSTTDAARGVNALLLDRDGNELGRLYHRAFDPNNGDHLIALVLRPNAPVGDWIIEISGEDVVDGRWHAWIERNAACPPCQAKFKNSSASRQTTTGSICNALRTIAVGAYDGHHPERPLAAFSSVGPTRDGRPKPLLVAPGVKILSVKSRANADDPPGYVRMSGTSMAAPHVTGTVALMLEAAGVQPIVSIRQILFSTLEPAPRLAGRSGQERWGYGLLNIEAAVAAARRLRAGQQPRPVPIEQITTITSEPNFQHFEEAMTMAHQESGSGANEFGESDPPGVTEPPRDQKWTKGRDQTLPSPEQRVLSQFSDAELRDMLDLPPQPPIAVAMREADDPASDGPVAEPQTTAAPTLPPVAEPIAPEPDPATSEPPQAAAPRAAAPPLPDPQTLINMAINPQVPSTQIIGWPGRRLAVPLLTGDVIIRDKRRRAAIVSRTKLIGRRDARRKGAKAREGGYYAETISDEGAERILGPDALILPDVMIIRSAETSDFGMENAEFLFETEPPSVSRPTIRNGSRGPAVSEAQTRLNIVHTNRTGQGQSALDRCPLTVDGVFGRNTRGATISFQRIAFPATPSEWDGVIGPKTWAALIIASPATTPVPTPPPAPPVPPVPVSTATIEFVLDDDGDHLVDGNAPVAAALMFGLWDQAYDGAGDVRNDAAETNNFIGLDRRRFYIRVNDPGASGSTVVARWRTLRPGAVDDDAPRRQSVTLTETAPGTKIFVSRALMLVTDSIDARQRTHSGFTTGPEAGLRSRGQSNHRLRRASLDGSVRATYQPAGGGAPVRTTLPVFQRTPADLRRRLTVNVVHYGITVTPQIQRRINEQFRRANARWRQTGLQIDAAAPISRAIPAAARDANGNYTGSGQSAAESAALTDLIGVIPDDSVTVCFTTLPSPRADGLQAFNAYATLNHRAAVNIGGRYFIFQHVNVTANDETLGHELHHVIHNRGDDIVNPPARQFFTFATAAPTGLGVTLPDARIYRRIQIQHGDPNNDPNANSIPNWMRRARTTRFNQPGNTLPDALDAPDATTGNVLTGPF